MRFHKQTPAERVIRWVAASRFLKDAKKLQEASPAFANILSEGPAERLLAGQVKVSKETVRQGRVRLDVTAMWLHRDWWQSLDKERVGIFIFIDGSPQWRGTEMFAGSVDVIVEGVVHRRILPCVALEHTHMDGVSKTIALLWAVFLMVGPRFEDVRAFCDRVIAICSDSGVEAFVVDSVDLLVPFFEHIGARGPFPAEKEYLFPLGLRSQGWRHVWDRGHQALLGGSALVPWLAGAVQGVGLLGARPQQEE